MMTNRDDLLNSHEAMRITAIVFESKQGMIITDANKVIIQVNKAFSTLTGYSAKDVIGKNPKILSAGLHDATFYQTMWQDIGRQGHWEGEITNKRKNGEIYTECLTISVVMDEHNKPTHYVATFTDISEIKRISKERNEFERQLIYTQKVESIGQLASGVAHDFNNILTPILGFTQMGMLSIEDSDMEEAMESFRQIEKAAYRATDLVKKILLFCREKTVTAVEGLTPISPTDVTQEVIEISEMLRAGISSLFSIEIDNQLTESSPSISVSPSELHQIITNLVVNARDAIVESWEKRKEVGLHNGTIKIRLFTASYVHVYEENLICTECSKNLDGEYVIISVSDTGSGISKEKIGQIFDPFFTTKEVGKGTGLGLSVVSGIMHNVNGYIIVNSEVGKGTTFSLLFPAVKSLED